jgi:hypothetical protein
VANFNRKTLADVPTSLTTLLTAASSTVVIGLTLCNKTGSVITAKVFVNTSAETDYYISYDVPIPVGSTLDVIAGNKVVLKTSDALQVSCGTSTSLDACVSYLEGVA